MAVNQILVITRNNEKNPRPDFNFPRLFLAEKSKLINDLKQKEIGSAFFSLNLLVKF